MGDGDGGHRGDDEPMTVGRFDREMRYRDMAVARKEKEIQREIDRKAAEVLLIAEKRAASIRVFVAVVGIIVPVVFGLLMLYLTGRAK